MDAYLEDVKKVFTNYKTLCEKAMDQLDDKSLFWCYNEESNSIAIIVQHMVGNMLSRWTDFFNTDGEKPWRNRDSEFEENIKTREDQINRWNIGWDCLFNALNTINKENWDKT